MIDFKTEVQSKLGTGGRANTLFVFYIGQWGRVNVFDCAIRVDGSPHQCTADTDTRGGGRSRVPVDQGLGGLSHHQGTLTWTHPCTAGMTFDLEVGASVYVAHPR